MPYFKDAEDVYANLGKLFEDIIADEDLRARFQGTDTVFQYRMRLAYLQVTVKALEADEPQVEFGVTKLQPEVVLAMDADTAHRFWLGKVNVTVALARGQISARGRSPRSSSSSRWSSPWRPATSPSSRRPGARTSPQA